MNTTFLKKMTKTDLIAVVANMSDGINWHDDHELSYRDADKLNRIAAECIEYCMVNKNWKLPNIVNDK